MQVKKFEAVNMAEAIEAVKRRLGSDAIILSTRKVKKGGGVFGILGRQIVEVTAAADPDYSPDNLKNTPTKIDNYKDADLPLNPLHKDIEELKVMVRAISRNNLPHTISHFPDCLASLYRQIVGNGVEGNLALKIIGEIRESLSEGEIKKDERVKDSLSEILNRLVRVSGATGVKKGRQRVIAFVGPTGVGKTTTIAKIAAKQALEEKRKVGLITMDTYRIAAIEQLKTYAKIIGIPVEVVLHGNKIKRAIEAHRDKDIILIDTAGKNHKNRPQMSELNTFLNAPAPIETHLVLSATTKEEDISDIYNKFKVIHIDRLLFTKLDESSTFGSIFNQAVYSKVPLSYFTTGQKVPEDIEPATRERLLNMILN